MAFEYDITRHDIKEIDRLAYYCSENGECSLTDIPKGQFTLLQDILNTRGAEGWELVQVLFGKDGLVVFWKREI